MRRTIASIPMIQSMQSEGASIERLYKKGILTDDMHYRMNEVKAFLDVEFQEVQTEADFLVPGWGQRIWQEGVQYYQVGFIFLLTFLYLFFFLIYLFFCGHSCFSSK